MKRNIITIGVALLIVVGIVMINRLDPDRRTADQIEASEQTEADLAEAEATEEANAAETQEAEDAQTEDAASRDVVTAADVKDQNVIKLKFECSNGDFVMEVHRDWAPLGVEQFLKAIEDGVYDDARFFRVVPGFVVQFGMPGDAQLGAKWRGNVIKDDPVLKPNVRGTICFATSGADSRTTQAFINLGDNRRLDGMGFATFGEIVEGMDTVDAIESKYGEAPNQMLIQRQGNEYLEKQFPDLDYIKKVTILESDGESE